MKEIKYVHKGNAMPLVKSVEIADCGIGYNLLMKTLRKKDVKINGKKIDENIIVSSGDEIKLYVTDADLERRLDADRIVYADANIIIADKPSGIDVNGLLAMLNKDYGELFLAHRLDRNTSGLICLARNEEALASLETAFKKKMVEKHYIAEVSGKLKPYACTLKAYLKKDAENSFVDITDTKKSGYSEIVTAYQVIEYREKSTLVDVVPKTGRTHQIRAHFAFIGHPIIGDGKYGRNSLNKQFKQKTQALRSCKLVFDFPEKSPLFYLSKKEFSLTKF